MGISRRFFLAATTAASASRVLGAGDRLRVGVIGTGGRGQYLMKELTKLPGVEWAAVCDVYDERRGQAVKIAGGKVEQYSDHRRLLEHRDLDAVIVATPDHWHGPIVVDACNAGKDVYVEKPMVHTPEDGIALVRAARRNRRVVQVGMQGRVLPQFVTAKQKFIDSGAMGKIGFARTWYMSNSGYVKEAPPNMQRKPDGLDWDRWLGRGPKVPWNPDIYFSPYKWLHYDGGMIMGIGIHVLDSARHLLNLKHPSAVMSGGGTYFYKDGRDTPDTVTCILDFPEDVTVTFSAEVLDAPGVKTSAGVELRGTGGKLWTERYVQDIGYEYTPNPKFSKTPAEKAPGDPRINAGPLLANWVECMRSRGRTICNEDEGHYSAVTCYMANIAFQKKTRIEWNKAWALPA